MTQRKVLSTSKDAIILGHIVDFDGYLVGCKKTVLSEQIVEKLRKQNVIQFLTLHIPVYIPDDVVTFYQNANIIKKTIKSGVEIVNDDYLEIKFGRNTIDVTADLLEKHLLLPNKGDPDPKQIDKSLWKVIALNENTKEKFPCKAIALKPEFQKLNTILSRVLEGKSGSYDLLTTPRAQLLSAIWTEKQVNWAKYMVTRLIEIIDKEFKTTSAEGEPTGLFHWKKSYGLHISYLIVQLKLQSKNGGPNRRILFSRQGKRKEADSASRSSKAKPTKRAKSGNQQKARPKYASVHEIVNKIPVQEGDAQTATKTQIEEPRQAIQTKEDKDQVAKDSVAAVDISEEVARFENWLTWKTSRSRDQALSIRSIHKEEEWIMQMTESDVLYGKLKAEELLESFKAGVIAFKSKGKLPATTDEDFMDVIPDIQQVRGDEYQKQLKAALKISTTDVGGSSRVSKGAEFDPYRNNLNGVAVDEDVPETSRSEQKEELFAFLKDTLNQQQAKLDNLAVSSVRDREIFKERFTHIEHLLHANNKTSQSALKQIQANLTECGNVVNPETISAIVKQQMEIQTEVIKTHINTQFTVAGSNTANRFLRLEKIQDLVISVLQGSV